MKRKVLDVGQCNADNYRINELLQKHFDAQVDRSHSLNEAVEAAANTCLLYTSPSPRDQRGSRMPSSA